MSIEPTQQDPTWSPPSPPTSEAGRAPGAGAGETAKDEARAVAEHARSQARDAQARAREKAQSTFDEQKARAAKETGALASALRTSAEQLEAEQHGGVAVYVRSAANVIERVSSSLEAQDFQGFVRDADRVTRQQPLLVFAGAAAIGFFGSRGLRAAREEG